MFERIMDDFPVLNQNNLIYLDTAASSLTPQSVIDKMNEYYHNYPVNVHRGVYALSHHATQMYEHARKVVADYIHADFHEIVYTRGATSALNLVAMSYGMHHLNPGDEIIVSELEHHSHLLPWQQVAKIKGCQLIYVPLDDAGRITLENFLSVLTDKTKVVALTYVSNVMGYITPLKPIIEAAHQKGAVVSIDAAQAAPHLRIDVKDLDTDFLAFSGHKMFGPTGIGILYGKKHLLDQMPPIEFGGDMNDNVEKFESIWKDTPYKFEAGTPPIAEAIGLAEAIAYLQKLNVENIAKHENELAQYTIKKLKNIDGVTVYNPTTETGIIAFNINGVHPHDAVTAFDENNIALRAGHHCAQLMIKWLKVPATLRASFYVYNTKASCDIFIENVIKAKDFFASVGF